MKKWHCRAGLLSLALALFLPACAYNPPSPQASPQPTPSATAQPQSRFSPGFFVDMLSRTGDSSPTLPDVIEAVSPAVVGLRVVVQQSTGDAEGIGTGFVVHESGYILTNHHVVGDATAITVIYIDGSTGGAQLIWSDMVLDLAIIKADRQGLAAVTLGDSSTLRVGDEVIAIGTPLTLQFQHSVTTGIVSALRRTLGVPSSQGVYFMEELIQTDASINPGNSGGPLCRADGAVIGINTLKITQAEGLGFAIPIDIAKPIVEHIIATGSYETPYIGLFAIDGEIARYYGEDGEGLYVVIVDEQGPLAKAGLMKGDRITRVAGREVNTVLEMRMVLYSHQVGDTITMAWQRGGEMKEVEVTLTPKPQP